MLGGCAGEVEDTGLEFYMYRLVVVSSSPWAWIFSSETGIFQMPCKEQLYFGEINQLIYMGGSF